MLIAPTVPAPINADCARNSLLEIFFLVIVLKFRLAVGLFFKPRIESDGRRFEIYVLDEFKRFRSYVFPVHTAVFPLYGERSLIIYSIQRPDNLFEIYFPASHTAEIPETLHIAEREVPSENSCPHRFIRPPHIFHVYVKYAVRKRVYEFHVIDTLVSHVARIVIEPECRMVIECFEGPFCRRDIECYFSRVRFEGKSDPNFLIGIEDRTEPACEFVEPCLNFIL